MVPPRAANFTGSAEDFRKTGTRLAELVVQLADLTPDARVLDIGCGVGRLAVALTDCIDERGSYEGLDVVEPGIKWCQEKITPRYPAFHFTFADVYNKEYNPRGRLALSQYSFPYNDEEFDVAVLSSVFTHMLPDDMGQYIKELQRVLKRGGRCFATYFLVNSNSKKLMASGTSAVTFKHDLGSHWLVNTRTPELSVGYDESYVRDIYADLFVTADIHYGGWCGRPPLWSDLGGLGDQDVLVATKG